LKEIGTEAPQLQTVGVWEGQLLRGIALCPPGLNLARRVPLAPSPQKASGAQSGPSKNHPKDLQTKKKKIKKKKVASKNNNRKKKLSKKNPPPTPVEHSKKKKSTGDSGTA